MALLDHKNRKILIGERVCVQTDIPSVNGMLYKNSIVKVDGLNEDTNKVRVTDSLGKVWWIEPSAVSASFL